MHRGKIINTAYEKPNEEKLTLDAPGYGDGVYEVGMTLGWGIFLRGWCKKMTKSFSCQSQKIKRNVLSH